ncbi:DNA methylase [Gallibacterium genomosp. 3]|uniref:site-specific DNA-methyltransferase (adenine-specific) n=1 Tax=Gallibacterium genomosp. 3 TaxID=505345 RepID=A0A1A7PNZ9_9PAST|nr:class I SAM-dependent DNA methyltransferase [Gallibacterium genomosp. 3]OBX04283.1 DNA methylase [Gallibacterium genomosp. 3]
MNHAAHNKLISFIWSIADDCLRDVYVRGKYRDVILPMFVLRRLDALLEHNKDKVLQEVRFQTEEMKLAELDDTALREASGYVFYNTSKWTMQSLYHTATNNSQILLTNFEAYLNSFSMNVKEIIDCFKLREQIRHMAGKGVLLDVVEKFVSPYINLTPEEKSDPEGNMLPALTNLGMGYVFEELIRKFNEENNEEAGEHFTPREVIELMTHLVFDPIKEQLPAVLTIYDPACGSGGMLTESEKFIEEKYLEANRRFYLYGKEINDETYAICKSDMMIKGNDPANIRVGSTLTSDEFAGTHFDFMLTNPPYGKSWSTDEKYIKDGKDIIDRRFEVSLPDYWGNMETVPAIPRTSDGQLLFLMEMISKMKDPKNSALGSRIASVHNGSALFTGDAGGGESNIRRYIIENDWLEAIIQLPNNLFYNTGITTYIWVLSNNKAPHRQGKVQLIDANLLYRKLRKNLGDKNCEFSPENIAEITQAYLDFTVIDRQTDSEHNPIGITSQIFDNQDFGYYKVTIERPDRRRAQFSETAIAPLRFDKKLGEMMQIIYAEHGEQVYQQDYLKTQEKSLFAELEKQGFSLNAKDKANLSNPEFWQKSQILYQYAQRLMAEIGTDEFKDFNQFKKQVDSVCKTLQIKLSASEKNAILSVVSEYDETAEKVIKKKEKLTDSQLNELLNHLGCEEKDLPDFGYYPTSKQGEYLTYESSSELRDSESVPLKDNIHRYFLAEIKPHIDEAWINLDSVKIGYEISFNKYFYQHKPLRSLAEVASDILTLEAKADGLIAKILGN